MLAEEAISKYAGIIPNIDPAGKLGYTVKNPAAISGPIYKRINELLAFGLFTRDRGALRTTDLAAQALDKYWFWNRYENGVRGLCCEIEARG